MPILPEIIMISAAISIVVLCLNGLSFKFIQMAAKLMNPQRHRFAFPYFAVGLLIITHLIGIFIFAVGFLVIGLAVDPVEAFYVSASLYTTSGPGTSAISPQWLLLARTEQWVGTAMFVGTVIFLISIRHDLFPDMKQPS